MNSRGKLPAHLEFGANGEAAAASYLANKGYKILARNWRKGRLEIDLICRHGDQIIFVEVKTRHGNGYGGAIGSLDRHKQDRLIRAAEIWLLQNGLWQTPCQFDVICIYASGQYYRMEHYPNAFSQAMDRCNAYW